MAARSRASFTNAYIDGIIKAPPGAVIDPDKTEATELRGLIKELRDSAAFLEDVSNRLAVAGGTMTGDLFLAAAGVGNETAPMRAVGYLEVVNMVMNTLNGWSWKTRCRLATTASLDLSAPGATIDGVAVAFNNRILVKNQSAQSQNGIYLWKGAAEAMVRSSDADTWDDLVNATTIIAEGTVNAEKRYTCPIDEGGTLGTNVVTWNDISGGSNYLNGTGLGLAGNVFSVLFATALEAQTGTDVAKAINAAVLKAELDRRLGFSTTWYALSVPGAGTLTFNPVNGHRQKLVGNLTQNLTLASLAGLTEGVRYQLHIKNTSATSYTLTLPGGSELMNSVVSGQTTLQMTAGKWLIIDMENNGTTVVVSAIEQF